MSSQSNFKIRFTILNLVQKAFLVLGAYIRPARETNVDFLVEFLSPSECGLDLIMIGDGTDGTYVLPDDLLGIEKCFSPGVGPSSQFEEALFDSYGIRSFLIDASVAEVPTLRNDFFEFETLFLGASTYEEYVDLDTWVNRRVGDTADKDLMLQMDIEGGEFAALLACSNGTLSRFRIIALELHFLDAINLEFFASTVEQTLRKLSHNFVVCFARANDCCGSIRIGRNHLPRVMEITLVRKDRIVAGRSSELKKFEIKNM